MTNLKPCPFCGGKVHVIAIELEWSKTSYMGDAVMCEKCNACMPGWESTKKWNKRRVN